MTSVDLVDYIAYALSAKQIPRVDWRQEAISVADDVIKDAFAAGYAARDRLCLASCGDGGKPVDRNDV